MLGTLQDVSTASNLVQLIYLSKFAPFCLNVLQQDKGLSVFCSYYSEHNYS